ncbi:low molecular weight phosphotyrosine protein phosphatase-like isoform X5 [Humulus lupulus]|uniref:low molecular weight phosphotyrosine protein phosphatase-like isoform X5 n=1 Tax=Humulus lupulus TaxID=3486 RepID=UPI002B408061|nr:low molecular weight phosphotyrosine protein phosphatase-like isoform X5 [Humulus lupulus]
MAASTETDTKPFSVLFVCLGNICRSPAAEGVFTDLVKKRGLDSKFKIDSAGTINYHEGNPADPRMRASSKSRGIVITSLSRPIRSSDFVDFDLSLAMDNQNRGGNLETLCLRMLIRRIMVHSWRKTEQGLEGKLNLLDFKVDFALFNMVLGWA